MRIMNYILRKYKHFSVADFRYRGLLISAYFNPVDEPEDAFLFVVKSFTYGKNFKVLEDALDEIDYEIDYEQSV